MKFVVPLTIPSTRCTFVTTSDSRRTLITGIAAHTEASKRSCTPPAAAASNSSAPRRATSCLLAVTTGRPERSSPRTWSPAGSTPPMTSATTWIDGSSRIVAKSSVSTPGAGACARSLPASRTSACVTRRRWPVARSISSAESSSNRCTAAPTVPYPSSATGTSTDATFGLPLPGLVHQAAELLADGLELGLGRLGAHLLEPRLVVVHVLDPLAGELAGLDVGQDPLHLLAHAVVDHALAARVVAELGRVRDRVAHACQPVLVHQI